MREVALLQYHHGVPDVPAPEVQPLIIKIESFQHKCVIIKRLLHPEQLKQKMVTILVEQLFKNSALYEHIYL